MACVAGGLALRLAFGLLYWTHQPLTRDEQEYLALGRSLARGDGFGYPADTPSTGTAQQVGRAPGYPAFLALLRDTTPAPATPVRVKIAQSIVGALGIWLIAIIAKRSAGPGAGLLAAAMAAVYPPLVWLPAYALSEALYSTTALAAALLIDRAAIEGRAGVSIAAGALVAAATLIRPATIVVLPLAAVWLVLRSRHAPALHGWRTAAVVTIAAVACILPWTIRNLRVEHRFVFVASEGGVTFWTGNHPLARGEGDLAANPDLKRADLAFRRAHPGLTPEQLEPLYYRDALRQIAARPVWWLGLLARKAFYTIVPIGPSYRLHSAKYFAASALAYGLVLPFGLVGLWRLRHAAHPPAGLWLMALATVVVELVFFPQERFRIPVIDPALIVSAATLGGPMLYERYRRRSDV